MSRAFIFPGQGSQAVGMGKALADAAREAAAVFQEVDDALGEKLSSIIWEGDEDTLRLTTNAQPALMAVSIAALKVIEARSGKILPDLTSLVAGHSLGEYTALTAAGTFSIADAARLLRIRGEAMQAAVPVGEGAMAAILNLDIDVVREIADEAAKQTGGICASANDNAPGQVVVSGHKAAVEAAIALATEKGAKRSLLLPVSAPFHCALMAPAAETMSEALANVSLKVPSVPVIANVTVTQETDPVRIRQLLVDQVTGAVRWRETVETMAAGGITQLVEVGAGKVLSGLARRIDKGLKATSIGTADDVEAFVTSLSEKAE